MKKTPMIIIILSCIAISVASVVLSHSNDKTTIPIIKITDAPTEITTQSATKYTAPKTTAVTVQTNTHEPSSTAVSSGTDNEALHININTADLETLCLLDGIGEVIASEIIKYREENGGFRNIEEIVNVNRIGEKTFNKIKNNIYVDNPQYPDEPHENTDNSYEENPQEIFSQAVETDVPITLDDVAPIELNSADKELMMYLPYVDENIADKIIELREKLHGFSNKYELQYIDELSDEQIKEIIQYIYIDKQ